MGGFIPCEQAVEKLLKAELLLRGETPSKVRALGHDVSQLATEVESRGVSWLSAHSATCKRLADFYAERYPDSPKRIFSKGTAEIDQIDALVVSLFLELSLPEEVKFRNGLPPHLFPSNSGAASIWPTTPWLLTNNKALGARLVNLSERSLAVWEHARKNP